MEEFFKSRNTFTNPIKIIGSKLENTFQSKNHCEIQKKNFEVANIFLLRDNCASSQPASHASPFSKMVEFREKGVYNRKLDGSVCYKYGREFGNNEVFCRGFLTLQT